MLSPLNIILEHIRLEIRPSFEKYRPFAACLFPFILPFSPAMHNTSFISVGASGAKSCFDLLKDALRLCIYFLRSNAAPGRDSDAEKADCTLQGTGNPIRGTDISDQTCSCSAFELDSALAGMFVHRQTGNIGAMASRCGSIVLVPPLP